MVHVIGPDDKPLAATNNHAMVRILLKEEKAVKVCKDPFTIKLLYDPAISRRCGCRKSEGEKENTKGDRKEMEEKEKKQQEAEWERQYAQYGCCIHEDVEEENLEEPAVEAPERM